MNLLSLMKEDYSLDCWRLIINNLIKLKEVRLIVAEVIMDRKMLFNSGRRSKKHLNEVHQRNIEKWSNAFED